MTHTDPDTDPDTDARADDHGDEGGELGWAAAVAELETILAELERPDVDVDHLAERVARAAVLLRVCRSRIDAARLEIDRVVADLDEPGEER